ncbi:MAG TPA: CoA transferase, partial [Candidatus Binatia bacterium]|nr:CoA transferase [Candidatus Binatia bacterium]
MQDQPFPLDGVRVLDFTWVVAGPVTTRLLADLGADVIKVERRGAVDFGDRRGGLSGALMRGKRSVVLNLADARGVGLARRLALASDVVIDNFSARVMTNLGLDHESLRVDRPDLLCVRMTGYGLTGPDRDKVSYGPTLQALTGYTLLMAE